jgi:hypothetical protein
MSRVSPLFLVARHISTFYSLFYILVHHPRHHGHPLDPQEDEGSCVEYATGDRSIG